MKFEMKLGNATKEVTRDGKTEVYKLEDTSMTLEFEASEMKTAIDAIKDLAKQEMDLYGVTVFRPTECCVEEPRLNYSYKVFQISGSQCEIQVNLDGTLFTIKTSDAPTFEQITVAPTAVNSVAVEKFIEKSKFYMHIVDKKIPMPKWMVIEVMDKVRKDIAELNKNKR